ncbi:MAG: class I SAM-dependent methyltransferase [Steroidobacteraceae bacterium]|jgi:SAM-dependent MidA family methyltransferase
MTPGDAVSILPQLPPDEARHGAAVLHAVRDAIATHGGWLAFDDYLRIVLYAPGLGYYSAGSAKFGGGGDFVTAPELSGLFGRCVARQCAEILQRAGGDVLELGAGTGALAASVLTTLRELELLPQHYYILEVSADLRARQQQRLASLPEALRVRVQWLDALPAAPIAGVILANEVADALPFKRFVVTSEAPLERGVAVSPQGDLFEADRPADAALQADIGRIAVSLPWPLPPGYRSELCPMLQPWIVALSAALSRGVALIIDYGLARREYYHPQRSGGTLRCHFRHRAHEDPLLHPGLQDISAWVDFTRVAEAAADATLAVAGYCTQAAFLLATGIESDLAAGGATLERARLASQARQLLLPGEMGESFKVMALTRGADAPLRGFEYQDLRRSL